MYHLSEDHTNNQGSIVGKFSPHDSSIESMLLKLVSAWALYFAGLNLQEWLNLFLTLGSICFMFLNIFILVRDKILKKPKKVPTDFGDLSQGD